MTTSASEDTWVEFMFVVVVMDVVNKEDVVEGDIVITHMNSPVDMEYSCQRPVHTLQANVASCTRNKIIIFKK